MNIKNIIQSKIYHHINVLIANVPLYMPIRLTYVIQAITSDHLAELKMKGN